MARSGINLHADFSELSTTIGAVSGMSKAVSTKVFADDLVKYTHSIMADRFDLFVDMAATGKGGHKRLHHVYEWGMQPGTAYSKLWRHKLLGAGGERNATWDWVASKKPIPTPTERASDPNDPMSLVPADELAYYSNRRYWFYWKAPVMELGQPVIILPVNAERLMFPTGRIDSPLVWTTDSVVYNPGGEDVAGSFTAIWASWWATEAPRAFDEVVEREFGREIQKAVRIKKRRSTATIGISAITNDRALQKAGEDWARTNIDRYRRSMALRARRRKADRARR